MKLVLLLTVLFALMLSACDSDLFDSNCRPIGDSGYSLCRDQNGPVAFYVESAGQSPSGGGVLDGTVQTIGWNDQVIIANRRANFRGDPDGLMVLDLATKKVAGPFSQDAVTGRYPSVKLSSAADAWESIH